MYKIMKRLYVLQILLCVTLLSARNNQQLSLGVTLQSAIGKSASKLKESVIHLIEENPVTSLAVITGASVCGAYYGVKYTREYFSLSNNPMPILTGGRFGENANKFNKALRFIHNQESLNAAITSSWQDEQRDFILERHHHLFDLSTAIHFLQRHCNDNSIRNNQLDRNLRIPDTAPIYIERFNRLNPNLLNPSAVFEWCIANEPYSSRHHHYRTLRFLLKQQDSFSERIKQEIINPCLECACIRGEIEEVRYLLSIGAKLLPEEDLIGRVLANSFLLTRNHNAVLYILNNQNVQPQEKEILTKLIFSVACRTKKILLVRNLLHFCHENSININVNTFEIEGNKLLHFACTSDFRNAENEALALIRHLIEVEHADMNQRNASGETALEIANNNRLFGVVDYLRALPRIKSNARDGNGI